MQQIVYQAGYRVVYQVSGKVTQKQYVFRRGYVTEIKEEDSEHILSLTSSDVPWCPKDPKTMRPFATVEDYILSFKKKPKTLTN